MTVVQKNKIHLLNLLLVALVSAAFTLPAQAQSFGGGPRNFGSGGQQQQGGEGLNPQRRQEMRNELMNLPPDQRRARMQQFRQQFQQQHQQKLAERKQKFQERWGRASPEQRQKFCGNIGQRCSGDNAGKPACQFAQSTCAGNK